MNRFKNILLIALVFISFNNAWAQNKNPLDQNFSYLYDYDATYLHPQFSLFNFSPDSSRLLVKVFPKEFIFQQKGDEPLMTCKIELVAYADWELKQIIDSTSISFTDAYSKDPDRFLIATLDYASPEFKSYVLEITVTDVEGEKVYMKYLPCSGNQIQSSNSFFAQNHFDNLPLMLPYAASYDSVAFFARRDHPKGVRIRYFKNVFPIAAPPSQPGAYRKFDYASSKNFIYLYDSMDFIALLNEGLYHLQYDTLTKTGFTLFRFDDNYPRIKGVDAMLECMRYIVSKDEYERLLSDKDAKGAFERFWMKAAGNMQSARPMINEYFTRVQNANTYFMSYQQGWKTDRGMVYIVMGKPERVELDNGSETWTYTALNGQHVKFVFEKIQNPFTENDYQLVRSELLDIPFKMQVEAWRTGAVFMEK